MTTAVRYRKSSRSSDGAACVELGHTKNVVRDSKNPAGPILPVDTRGLAALLALVKGEQPSC